MRHRTFQAEPIDDPEGVTVGGRFVETTGQESALTYDEFLHSKIASAKDHGVEVTGKVHPILKPHQRDIVQWMVRKGRAACFASFGLGKTIIQLEVARLITEATGGNFLIITPLGVRQEFKRDAFEKLEGLPIEFIRSNDDLKQKPLIHKTKANIFLTNYESVREGKIDVNAFVGCSLDEASALRGFGGTKTFREFMKMFEGNGKYKFVATATPSPNEYIELLAYSAFLDVMDVSQAKTRFFKRDSTKADHLTLHPHKEREFWLWMSQWAVFLQKPSDLGYSDEGYVLPEMDVYWHEVPTDHRMAGYTTGGQGKLLKDAAIGVSDAAREKRDSLDARIAKMMELRKLKPGAHCLIWHDLEDERRAIEKAIPAAVTVYGTQPMDERERAIIDFSDGAIQDLAAKPVMAGSGCNFQRHCAWEVFLGIGFKFNDFIQGIYRVQRFLQTERVRIDIIYTEAERAVREVLQRKWENHKRLVQIMAGIIHEYGLAKNPLQSEFHRSIGVGRTAVKGEGFTLVNNDSVLETAEMETNSIHLILTSIPFSTQYEYTPSYNDFGHTDSNEHFWRQMDFLTPNLTRVLKPGRVAVIHVKDRIVPGGLKGLGFQTVYPFHADAIRHYEKHGLYLIGMKTIVTDVVRENNQTYRLGWTEQCKDGSRMGVGMPEYLLIFRKPPTDPTRGYADEPVVKSKDNYSRSRWQIDAHGFARSNGNRPLTAEDFRGIPHERIFKLFRKYSFTQVYDYENHVALSEALETCSVCHHIHTTKKCEKCECKHAGGILPVTFMLLQPQSWSDEVWTDVARMLSLNSAQSAAGREMHLCPMQFDICDRVINQFSMPGETVLDPFAGIGSVPFRALKLKRKAIGIELAPGYFRDALLYCQAAEREIDMPTLFDLTEEDDHV